MEQETGPATEASSAYEARDVAARLFGEEVAGNYLVDGRLIRIYRLPVGALPRRVHLQFRSTVGRGQTCKGFRSVAAPLPRPWLAPTWCGSGAEYRPALIGL